MSEETRMTDRKPTGRCPICDWPLAATANQGCVEGNCSYRPEYGSEEWYRIQRNKVACGHGNPSKGCDVQLLLQDALANEHPSPDRNVAEKIYADDAFIDAAVKYKFEGGALMNVVQAALAAMGDAFTRKDEDYGPEAGNDGIHATPSTAGTTSPARSESSVAKCIYGNEDCPTCPRDDASEISVVSEYSADYLKKLLDMAKDGKLELDPYFACRLVAAFHAIRSTEPVFASEMSLPREHGMPCYYCGEPADSLSGNPGKWPIALCHKDEPAGPAHIAGKDRRAGASDRGVIHQG